MENLDIHNDIVLDVIVVTYNSAESIGALIDSLASSTLARFLALIVVDNCSTDDTLATLSNSNCSEFRELVNIFLPRNLGFATAANIGAARARSNLIAFVNPDVIFGPRDLELLVRFAHARSFSTLVSPIIKDMGGRSPIGGGWFPSNSRLLHELLRIREPKPDFRSRYIYLRGGHALQGSISVDWVAGTCLLVPSKVFTSLGGFDSRYFLYCEDIDLCYRASRRGYKAAIFPELAISHIGGSSHGQPANNLWGIRSLFQFYRRSSTRSFLSVTLFGLLLILYQLRRSAAHYAKFRDPLIKNLKGMS